MAHKIAQPTLDERYKQVETVQRTSGLLHKLFTLEPNSKAVDDEQRTVKFVITTGAVDRDNDTISPKGWDVAPYLKNPVVLWAHDYSQLPVARALDMVPTATGLESTAQFPPKGVHPFADTVFELIKGGFLNATSVGFRPLDAKRNEERGGIDFEKQEMLEYSIVPVPANAEALTVARSKGIDISPLTAWAADVMKQTETPTRLEQLRARVTDLKQDVAEVLGTAAKLALVPRAKQAGVLDTFDAQVDKLSAAMEAMLKDVAPAGEATGTPCPACGYQMESADHCTGCGWQGPAGIADANGPNGDSQNDMHAAASDVVPALVTPGEPILATKDDLKSLRALNENTKFQPTVSVGEDGTRWATFQKAENDPIRWNRQHSKAFDVAGEPAEACRTELAWIARYLDTPIQSISSEEFYVPAARMASFLSAYEEGLADWQVEATRCLSESGKEVPPEHESIQLNSKGSRSFLVRGSRYMRRAADGAKLVGSMQPTWSGLFVTHYVRHEQAEVRTKFINRVQTRAAQINYLRGEAFTLSGEFLDRGNLDWDALFLESKEEGILRRAVDRINEHGENMESRGLMEMGPPGTGKTMSGRVMMRQADTTFIWVSARDFYRSGSYGAFTYAFDIAAECAPSIIFFEDVDNWISSTEVDLLKTEMDGLKRRKGILTVLTTNFPELIPDALIDRPGRFHDLVELALPTEAVRVRMLAAWLPESTPEQRAATAKDTDGFSGAHLRELVNFATTIGSEEKIGTGDALARALAKLKEQRELVASLREAPDYRPRRQVRSLVAGAMGAVAKRGRVLSGANESRLRTACDHMTSAAAHVENVLAAVAPDEPDDEAKTLAIEFAEAVEGDALEIADDEPELELDATEMQAAIDGALQQALANIGPMVREQTTTALARARGRVD